MNRIIC